MCSFTQLNSKLKFLISYSIYCVFISCFRFLTKILLIQIIYFADLSDYFFNPNKIIFSLENYHFVLEMCGSIVCVCVFFKSLIICYMCYLLILHLFKARLKQDLIPFNVLCPPPPSPFRKLELLTEFFQFCNRPCMSNFILLFE